MYFTSLKLFIISLKCIDNVSSVGGLPNESKKYMTSCFTTQAHQCSPFSSCSSVFEMKAKLFFVGDGKKHEGYAPIYFFLVALAVNRILSNCVVVRELTITQLYVQCDLSQSVFVDQTRRTRLRLDLQGKFLFQDLFQCLY